MTVYPQIPAIETGVPRTLAKWRAAHYSDVRYKLDITLEKGAPLMKGELEISVNLTEEGAKNDLILDWRTTQFANDKEKPYAHVVAVNNTIDVISSVSKEHLIIPKGALKTGANVIKIRFASPIKTSGAAVTRYVDKEDGAEYVYSLFVPSDASTALPVFDQPDLKARFQLNVKTPGSWKVISNTPLSEESNTKSKFLINPTGESLAKNPSSDGVYLTVFTETKPISTYVFAFAAGRFVGFSESLKGFYLKTEDIPDDDTQREKLFESIKSTVAKDKGLIYVRRSQVKKFEQHAAEVFRLNREGVRFLEGWFDYKFPFPKYDLVLIPEFPFNGMEHAGATFLRESSVIFPSEPTKNDLVSRANVIFHEAAHQWFGDTVTMKWFDDLWLKEGFAEFMAYKTLEKTMPEYDAWKAFYERNKPLAYLTDSTAGTTPIYQEITNLSAAKSAYGNIVYRKAPSFLRQAEFYLGEDKFQTAVRAFLKKYQFKNAEWTDLVREFETASQQDLKDWANVWVTKRGLSIFRIYSIAGGMDRTFIRQQNVFDEDTFRRQRLKVLLVKNSGEKYEKEIISAKIPPEQAATMWKDGTLIYTSPPENPEFIFPNYQDYGYGIFLLDERSREYVLKNIQNEKDDFLRSMMWGTLWDSVREAELNPKDYVELAIKNIAVETDELTIGTILNRVSTAMNYYLSDAQRAEAAPPLENLLIEKIRRAPTLGQRITFYRAFLNIASTENARNVLKRGLLDSIAQSAENSNYKPRAVKPKVAEIYKNGTVEFPPLKTKDKFDIVTKLAILNDADAAKLLADLVKAETSDDAKRYAYAVGAGFGTQEAKEKYFNDFLNNKEISESWIEAAFVPFNSVRHSESTLPFLEKALAELPNLKRSRKIFFVNGWLAAFIGGQKDEKARAAVNKFLADNPSLDKDLRLKILENADALERAVKIRDKYGK